MRVISGKRGGMNLYSPRGYKIRPTEDRVKEAIFNTLYHIPKTSVCLDLFAGSGGVGIEFISRGSEKVAFSEIDRNYVDTIEQNLAKTEFQDYAQVYHGDFRRNLQNMSRHGLLFDYVFIDPPYRKEEFYYESLKLLKELSLIHNETIIILEADIDIEFEKIPFFELEKTREYSRKKRVYYGKIKG